MNLVVVVAFFDLFNSYWIVEWAKAIGPILAALIAVGGVAWAAYATLRAGFLDARYDYASRILEFRIRQMQEFYVPILLHIEKSRLVYDKLKWTIAREKPDFDLTGFRLLDHPEFKGDPITQSLVAAIMETGEQITKLIAEKAGLIEGRVVAPYMDYQGHFAILKAVMEGRATAGGPPGWQELGYYPRLLNRVVLEGYKIVLFYVQQYKAAGDELVSKLLHRGLESDLESYERLLDNLTYYEQHFEEYKQTFDQFDFAETIDAFLALIRKARPPRGPVESAAPLMILDAGAGTGRDTQVFIERGCVATAFDASPSMVRECNRKIRGLLQSAVPTAKSSRCLELTFDDVRDRNRFDGIWAAASLLHVPEKNMKEIIATLSIALRRKGLLYLSVKYGSGESEYDARYYSHFRRGQFRKLIGQVGGLKIIDIWLTDSSGKRVPLWKRDFLAAVDGFKKDRRLWLNLFVQKIR